MSNAAQVSLHGVELVEAGRLDEARNVYRSLLRGDIADPDALHRTAYLALQFGEPAQAVKLVRRALRKIPDQPYYCNTLGIALRHLRRWDEAVDALRRAVALAPQAAEPWSNLGNVFRNRGDHAQALGCFRRALQLAPQVGAHWSGFADSVWRLRLTAAPDAAFRGELIEALARPEVTPLDLAPTAMALLGPSPELSDPLLLRLIESMVVPSPQIEALLTAARARQLRCWAQGEALPLGLEAACALARQCFLTEYAYAVSEEEAGLLVRLRAAAAGEAELALLAAYEPLQAKLAPGADLAGYAEPLKALIRQQVIDPAREAELRAAVPALTPIEEGASQRVRSQYEANPYPRWSRVGRYDHARPLAQVLYELFPHRRLEGLPVGPLEVLVAGCGTGSHAIEVALRYAEARVFAIDLSRASLAYAALKTEQLGLSNIEYAQADILQLGEWPRRFPLIESVGVLHHLADPLAGWRVLLGLLAPGGLMRIGLYSELARRGIVRAQEFARRGGFGTDPAGLRALRAALRGAADPLIAQGIKSADFYSLSGCRDLYLHAQEQRFTLPQLGAALDGLGLEFIGFELRDTAVLGDYRARFPDNPAADDLARWHAFETEHPGAFAGMYVMWLRRRPASG